VDTNDTNKENVELPTSRMGEDGKPIYDQEFFLALARCGKDAWNRWRETNPEIKVTFEGIDFREPNKDINFSKFQFGDDANLRACWFGHYANLSGATFGDRADLSGVTFGAWTDLSGVIFGKRANLSGATFGDMANLREVTFGDRANLSGATFGDVTYLNGATFGNGADLREATFGDNAVFDDATFGHRVDLSRATFGVRAAASFVGATFGHEADLSGTTFKQGANLMGVTFGEGASFPGARFGGGAYLIGANFKHAASFSGARFGVNADLSGATFGAYADFSGASFESRASFSGATFGTGASFSDATFFGDTDLTAKSIDELRERFKKIYDLQKLMESLERTLTDAKPKAFTAVSFASARFNGTVDFSGRDFSERCDLTRARFGQPPKFDECEHKGNIDLNGAAIRFSGRFYGRRTAGWTISGRRTPGWTTDSDVARRLRVLRKLADETKNHDLERDLYIEERKAERGIKLAQLWATKKISNLTYQSRAFESPVWFVIWSVMRTDWRKVPPVLIKLIDHWLWIAVMVGYWALSNYGRSFVRPLLALGLSILLFKCAYVMAVGTPSAMAAKDFEGAARAYAIANSLPFVGALTLEKDVKMILLCAGRQTQYTTVYGPPICSPLPSPWFQLVTVVQSIFSAICLFFAGLALRNYFKLR
jgi:Pentapeptide repeats (9 copies)